MKLAKPKTYPVLFWVNLGHTRVVEIKEYPEVVTVADGFIEEVCVHEHHKAIVDEHWCSKLKWWPVFHIGWPDFGDQGIVGVHDQCNRVWHTCSPWHIDGPGILAILPVAIQIVGVMIQRRVCFSHTSADHCCITFFNEVSLRLSVSFYSDKTRWSCALCVWRASNDQTHWSGHFRHCLRITSTNERGIIKRKGKEKRKEKKLGELKKWSWIESIHRRHTHTHTHV